MVQLIGGIMIRKPVLTVVLVANTLAMLSAQDLPQWAYGTASALTGGRGLVPDTATPRTLPGGALTFTLSQIRDGFGAADWFPGGHPPMPTIVAHGRRS